MGLRAAPRLQRDRQRATPLVRHDAGQGPNLTEAASNLYKLVKGRILVVYPDDPLRLAVSRAVAIESARGVADQKDKQAHWSTWS